MILPSLGESVTEGIVTRWMKSVGDSVERDEALYEISTDKVDSEMPAPASGVLVEIRVPEGETVFVGAVLAVISEDGSVAPTADPSAAEPATASTPQPETSVPPASMAHETTSGSSGSHVTSPFVRRDLAAAGVASTTVVGTGPGGRITRSDAAQAFAGAPRIQNFPTSAIQAPTVAFLAIEARFDRVDEALASAVASAAAEEGVELNRTVVAIRAAVEALAEFPELNGWVDSQGFVPESSRNIGIDVELEQGLAVPVVHDAQDLTLRGLAKRISEIAERVRTRSLGIEDLLDATFSISKSPSDEVLLGVPVLRTPQVAALSIGAVRRRPVVEHDEGGAERLGIAPVGILGLTYDASTVEPSLAAGFLARIADLLSSTGWDAQL